MSPLTTHVLDTRLGRPAVGVGVHVERRDAAGGWQLLASGATDSDGRVADLLDEGALAKGHYRLSFETGGYFENQNIEHFYPQVAIEFTVADEKHYHVPLLLSPFGYSTYRGS